MLPVTFGGWVRNVADKQPITCTDTKMKLVGNGSEKAKHHNRPSSGKPKTQARRIRKGQTPQQAELRQAKNTSQKKCFPSPLESIKHFLWPAPSLRGWVRNVADKQPITCTDTKMKLVGNGSEKAKHHNRPSSGKPKTQARKNASRHLWRLGPKRSR